MIRPALATDAPAIAALMNHWIAHTVVTFTPTLKTVQDIAETIAAKAKAGHGFLVAMDGDRLLGQASYGQFRAGAGYATCMEHSISLAPDARGGGIGRALMQAVEDHARNAGAHQMIGGVSGENAEGRAFHDRLGYRLIATVPQAGFKFGRHIDLLLMQKFL